MLPNNVANNVQGTQSSKEKLKLIQYFKDKIGLTEVWVPQETNYDSKVEQKWQEDLKVMFSFLKKNNKYFCCPNCSVWERNFYH